MIDRRSFIRTVALGISSLPLAAEAQEAGKVCRGSDSSHSVPAPGRGRRRSARDCGISAMYRSETLIYTVQFNASPSGSITLWPVIDGVTELSGQRNRDIGDFSGQVADVTFARIFALASGAHTFGLRATCQSTVVFSTSWLTVYELPKSKQGKGQQ